VVYFFLRPSMNDNEGSGFLVGRIKEPAFGMRPSVEVNIRFQECTKPSHGPSQVFTPRNSKRPLELYIRTFKILRAFMLARMFPPHSSIPFHT